MSDSQQIPEGCYKFTDYDCVLRKDIHKDRPYDQRDISVEHAIRHSLIVVKRWRPFKLTYWAVLSTTTYEMSGNYLTSSPYMGGRCWAETDETGLEWRFKDESLANRFVDGELNRGGSEV